MSRFVERVTQDTPRMVVLFKKVNKDETFQWGIVGQFPPLSLIGAITRAQVEIFTIPGEECPDSAFVITWDAETRQTTWYVHSSVPVEPLVGMLETIKLAMVSAMAQKGAAAASRAILGPDGRPMPR